MLSLKKLILLFPLKIFKAVFLIAFFIFAGNIIASVSGITEQVSKIFYWPVAGQVAGKYTVRIAQAGGTNWNPPYPRVVVGYPANESHFTGCRDFYSQFNMVKLSGDAAFCVQAAESVNPNIIKFGTWGGFDDGNFPSDENSFGYHIFRSLDPRTATIIDNTTTDVPLENTDGTGFPRWEYPLGSGNYPYGTVGSSVFVVGTAKQSGVISYQPDRFSYSSVNEANSILEGVGGIDRSHVAHSYIRIPIKIRGWSPNVTAVNPYGGDNAIDYYLNNKYSATDIQSASHFDGIWYDTQTFKPNDYSWSYTDFDMNWQDDEAQYGLNGKNNIWYQGLHNLFNTEKNRTGVNFVISNDGYGVLPPEEVVGWHDGFVVEKCMKGLYDWQLYFDTLRLWDSANKFAVCIDGSTEWTASKYLTNKNRYADMRFGLAMNAMGPGYYGRAVGPWFFIHLLYDEYDVELGSPLGAPAPITTKCNGVNGRCPYIRFFDNGAVIVNHTLAPVSITESDIGSLAGYAGPYYRFYGGQDPLFNNGHQVSNSDPVNLMGGLINASHDGRNNSGDGVILVKSPDYFSITDVLVGNFNNNDTSPGSAPVEISGSWNDRPPTSPNNPYYSQWDQDDASASIEGIGYFVTSDPSATATFRPTIGLAGEYQVFEWHGWHGNSGGDDEASNVPYKITISGNMTKSGAIDQKTGYGKWNLLGIFSFPAGENSSVKISANGANGVVIADVVKFVFTGNAVVTPPPPPVTLKADLNCDNKVDVYDLGILMSCWGGAFTNYPACKSGANLPSTCNKSPDINGDGSVEVSDLGIMLSCWGTNNSPQCSTTAVIGTQTCDRCMTELCSYYNSCNDDTGTNCASGEHCCTGTCSAPIPAASCDHCLPQTCDYYTDCYGDTGTNCASGESCCSGTCGAPVAVAGSFYVSASGNDSTGDGLITNPWRTINFALNNAAVVAGSTIYARAGNYNESVNSNTKSGQASQIITLKNYQNETATIDGNGLGDKPCVDFKNSAYLKISGIKIINCGNNGLWLGDYGVAENVDVSAVGKVSRGRGIVMENAQSAQILNSHIHDNQGVSGSDGIFLWNSDNVLVRGNNIHDNSDDGIDGLEGVVGATIENNIIYNNSNDALKLGQFGNGPGHGPGNEAQNNIVRNNLTYNNSYGLTITGFNNQVYNNTVSTGPSRSNTFVLSGRDNVVKNNIINASFWMRNGNAPPQTHNEVSMTIEYNLLYDGTVTTQDTTFLNFSIMCTRVAQGCNSIDANPFFVNKAGGADFHLQSTSPAINSGTTVPVNYDLENNPRPVGGGYDLGAYEYNNAAAPN